MSPSDALKTLHESLCDDCSPQSLAVATIVINYFAMAEVITNDQAKLRVMALLSCPGHNGSRSWCAYCGDLPAPPTAPRDGEKG